MKISIIGAGVAGLSAGCYLRMNDFETEIFERHSTFGGLCTHWQRDGYNFESGLQWVLGTNENNPFYHLWSELIDMSAIRFINHDVRMEIEVKETHDNTGDNVFHLYTNLNKLETYMLSIAPEDGKVIRRLIRSIRKIQTLEIPPMIKEVPKILPWYKKIGYIKYLPLLLFLQKVKPETNVTFARKLKNPFLKEAFKLLFDGEEMSLLVITLPLAYNDLKSTGYPVGGSAALVRPILHKYLELGGKIRYETEVVKIITEKKHATGILLKSGELITADIVISAADWHFTLFSALEGKFIDSTIKKLKNQEQLKVYPSVFMVSLGVAQTFQNHPHFLRFPLLRPLVSPDGSRYDRMEVHINNYDPTHAPVGKTVISVSFYSHFADFWITLRNSNQELYREEKKKFADVVIALLDEKLGKLKNKIEVIDIATPATFQRYTNNWKGSVQGWFPGKNIIAVTPVKNELPGLKDFYFIGHWTQPGGGLPVALKSARDTAKLICYRNGITFSVC
ncbi:MAG: NAD(P)/FAD-dependent oxidoreductase [Bacteroidales bacterium]|jgi:phytoene dehydrogenase-like protein|nr:NAD(P)/FAD-dependent oxidoreductase [Bacteroidales bacterium]